MQQLAHAVVACSVELSMKPWTLASVAAGTGFSVSPVPFGLYLGIILFLIPLAAFAYKLWHLLGRTR